MLSYFWYISVWSCFMLVCVCLLVSCHIRLWTNKRIQNGQLLLNKSVSWCLYLLIIDVSNCTPRVRDVRTVLMSQRPGIF